MWNTGSLPTRGFCRVCWSEPQQPPLQRKLAASATKVIIKSHCCCWPPREGDVIAPLPGDMHGPDPRLLHMSSHPQRQNTRFVSTHTLHPSFSDPRMPHLRHHGHHRGTPNPDSAPRGIPLPMTSTVGEREVRRSPTALSAAADTFTLGCCNLY